ncbi:MAG: lysophospholipid acyltransferase family protein [Clostridia bacterium]|nr:lysophospholipid acyltransferase family protein [Clostridia bacterium]
MLYVFAKIFIAPLIALFLRPKVFGRENLYINGKAVICCNHRSAFDPVLLAVVCPRLIHFMAKKELFKNKLIVLLFKSLLAFPVNRGVTDVQSLKSAINVLNKGKVFGIFPEGKRAVTDQIDKFEKGTAYLAMKTNAPVIPVYIHPRSYKRRPVMIVGRPINVNKLIPHAKKSDLVSVATDEIADAINRLKVELEGLIEANHLA